MPEDLTNYDKLQHCSAQLSRLIRLEEAYRAGVLKVDDVLVTLEPVTVDKLKTRFAAIRQDIISTLNSITG